MFYHRRVDATRTDLTPGALTRLDQAAAAMAEMRAAQTRLYTAIHALDTDGVAVETGHRSTSRLLEEHLHLDRGDARRLLRHADLLTPGHGLTGQPTPAALPATADALGVIDDRHVTVIAGTMKTVDRLEHIDPDTRDITETQLAALARDRTPNALADAATEILALLDPDGAAPTDRAIPDNELHLLRRADGSLAGRFRYTDPAAPPKPSTPPSTTPPRPPTPTATPTTPSTPYGRCPNAAPRPSSTSQTKPSPAAAPTTPTKMTLRSTQPGPKRQSSRGRTGPSGPAPTSKAANASTSPSPSTGNSYAPPSATAPPKEPCPAPATSARAPASAPKPPAASPATPRSSPPSSTPPGNPSTSGGDPASSPSRCATPSSSATATAPTPDAANAPANAPSTTSATGPTAAPPRPTTWCCSAPTTTP